MDQQRSPSGSSTRQPYLTVSVPNPLSSVTASKLTSPIASSQKRISRSTKGPEKIVIRRYSDFIWLRDRLFEKYTRVFIPAVPEKSAIEKFRFSAEFIEMRHQALDVFINRVASHQELQKSEDLRTFLQVDEEIMERLRSQELGIFKKKPSDLLQIFKDVQSKVSDVVRGKEKPLEESNPEFEKLKHYVFELENHLTEAQKHAYRPVKKHRETGQSLSDFGEATKLLGAYEGEFLCKAFNELGTKSEAASFKLQDEAHQLLMNVQRDYFLSVTEPDIMLLCL